MKNKETFWTPLDNAAKIFPAVKSKEHTGVIRVTAVLKDPVSIRCLFKAVETTSERFSYFKVRLRRGFFWFYLEQCQEKVSVVPDTGLPCRLMGTNAENKLLLRVLVYRNTISVEFSHILTDGYGLFTFMKSILLFYFHEKGLLDKSEIDPEFLATAADDEFEDAYSKYFKEKVPPVIRKPKAFHFPFEKNSNPGFSILHAFISISELKQRASEKDVSITEYLVAVYLLIIQDIYYERRRMGMKFRQNTARISVPINLRNIYPTNTMRNFSLFAMPEIDFRLGRYSFDEILKIVYHRIRLDTDEKLISKIISRNVGGEKKIFVRTIPIWLKTFLLYQFFYRRGANQYSGVVTNLGKISLPDPICDEVEYFSFSPPPPNRKLKINLGVIGYGDKLVLSFGNITNTKEFEQKYLQFLTRQGIQVKIKT